jgi:hypothetical protein
MATLAIEQTATHLCTASCLGAIVGFERQWHPRLAGLRTNTPVGARRRIARSAHGHLSGSRTRVAARVILGIDFLGPGIIFREGLNVRRLKTAATLWCSAAIVLRTGGRVEPGDARDVAGGRRQSAPVTAGQAHQSSAAHLGRASQRPCRQQGRAGGAHMSSGPAWPQSGGCICAVWQHPYRGHGQDGGERGGEAGRMVHASKLSDA